jgi:integrase/recombinase XerD
MSETNTVSPLRQRMIEDMVARKLNPHTQRSHIYSCKRLAAWLKRSPDTATPDEVRRFQLYLIESGASICNRNRIMTGVRFLFRVTLRRHDLAAKVWHIKEPQKLPPVLSPEEVRRVLSMARSLKADRDLRPNSIIRRDDVYSSHGYVGSDPDPRVRDQLRHDPTQGVD